MKKQFKVIALAVAVLILPLVMEANGVKETFTKKYRRNLTSAPMAKQVSPINMGMLY